MYSEDCAVFKYSKAVKTNENNYFFVRFGRASKNLNWSDKANREKKKLILY